MVNFYPDVSLHTHGPWLRKTLPLYQHIFTTKTFGIHDLNDQLGITNASFIPHGYDPDIHRELPEEMIVQSGFQCDASFIGTWSPKKEKWLSILKSSLPELKLKIWGNQWEKASSGNIQTSIQGKAVEGDLYALAIQASKINLGILSEQVRGASSGDKITSRTFHIPGAGGFMLHERNEESIQYFREDQEAAFFGDMDELTQKVSFYLQFGGKRDLIAANGHQRALKDHSLDQRARLVVDKIGKL